MKRSAVNSLAIGLVALTMSACVSSGTQVKESALTQFQNGVTSETDVIKSLGTPQGVTKSTDGTRVLTYVGMHAQPKAASFIPVVGLFAGGAQTSTSVVTFNFGTDGKLTSMSSNQSQASARMGLGGAQPTAPEPKVVN